MAVKSHATKLDAREHFQEAFDEVTVKDLKWMAAVWCVENGKIVLKRVTTSKFDHGDFCFAVGKLGVQLHDIQMTEKEGPMLPNDPLPRAEDLGLRIVPTPDPGIEVPKIEPVLDPESVDVAGTGNNEDNGEPKDEVADQ